jgi:hypothetical protein
MHPPHVRAEALALIEQGLNDCEVSRRIGIPRSTIRDWRRPTYVPREPATPREICPRCWLNAKRMRFSPGDDAELLGMYLGDGCISQNARTKRLRIVLDAKYPGIISDARALLSRCFLYNDAPGCVHISVYPRISPASFPSTVRALSIGGGSASNPGNSRSWTWRPGHSFALASEPMAARSSIAPTSKGTSPTSI